MSTSRLSELPRLAQNSSSADAGQVSLLLSLTATPSARLTREISDILKDSFEQPHPLLGRVEDIMLIDLRLDDPGTIATETLARRLLKLSGIRKLKAARVCRHRGTIFAISLQSSVR